MVNNKKMNADKNLAKEQFKDLNKEFYSNYMDEYYFIKLNNLLNMISRTNEYQESIDKVEVELGKIKTTLDASNTEKIQQYAKMELTNTYFHCLETFIRLFISHANLSGCPWLDISRLTIQDYRRALKRLANDEFEWLNNKLSGDNTVLFVLLGYSELPKEMDKKDLKGFRKWISWAANELLNNYEYNTFKHGLAIYTNFTGFKMENSMGEFFKKYDECLQFLKREENDRRFVWVKKTIFIPYDSRVAIIYTFAHLIKDILVVGNYLYSNGEYKIEWIPNHKFTPEFVFNNNEESIKGIPIQVKGYSMQLKYYK
ncbi:TPA: hypothetical protein ACY4SM_001904 [Clostridium perfringens]|uniref:hypothetical protein n=2 Tax=Clostridium perfringens TaxID=1502 RepID=UPI00110741B3|nr:hypothetical protein [Clostridium perfringens]MDM0666313.1 hypothetical protein [Clostridium perfringens]MDU6209462.1 hypothetical protein [Clostridium perfringens]MDZ4988752.1 hypothetical protein [Clostridium perfringens]MDZ5028960.1 hypothetical protein [Clostridium perfringens]MDZ5064021.1 hypothetical protein [Clostridium perfringens]